MKKTHALIPSTFPNTLTNREVFGEHGARGFDRRDLELLLGAEVGEEAALAHPHRPCQPADREPIDALDRGELSGFTQDRLPAALPVTALPARARRQITDLCVTHH